MNLKNLTTKNYIIVNIYNILYFFNNPFLFKVLTDYKTSHRANIFSAKFLPNSGDHRIVSCSGDGIILYTGIDIDVKLRLEIWKIGKNKRD